MVADTPGALAMVGRLEGTTKLERRRPILPVHNLKDSELAAGTDSLRLAPRIAYKLTVGRSAAGCAAGSGCKWRTASDLGSTAAGKVFRSRNNPHLPPAPLAPPLTSRTFKPLPLADRASLA